MLKEFIYFYNLKQTSSQYETCQFKFDLNWQYLIKPNMPKFLTRKEMRSKCHYGKWTQNGKLPEEIKA